VADDRSRDELLRRARELGDKADAARAGAEHGHESAAERFGRENRLLRSIFDLSARAGRVLGPIGTFLGWLLAWFGRWLRWVTIVPASSDGRSARFSISRTLRNLVVSAMALFGLHVLASAIYYYATYFEETVYVTGKQEIVTGELYEFGGCTSLPCSTESDNGKFYLIESSLYFPVMLYPEEEVFANVPHQDAACNVEGYGIYFRTLRWIYKTFQLYQHVVDVSCRPYTEDEIRRAVEEGEIVRDPPPE
jgi:hypothetical protein